MAFQEIHHKIGSHKQAGMTTLAAVLTDGQTMIATSVGDSNVYLQSGSATAHLNADQQKSGFIGSQRIQVHQAQRAVARGDRILLVTDGIWKYVPYDLLVQRLKGFPAADLLSSLIQRAAASFGGSLTDDATGVLVQI
jgi:serine/threonine protein phosphatase PrpC